MITREQIADLQPGDVVEMFHDSWPSGTTVRGPLYRRSGGLYCSGFALRFPVDGEPMDGLGGPWRVTVVSRAPRPLYVNHLRTEPVPGDVVRDADRDLSRDTWTWNENRGAWSVNGLSSYYDTSAMPKRLRLLVDGETGQVVL